MRVINQAILAQQLLVETEDHRRVLINASDVLTVLRRGSNAPGKKKDRDRRKKNTKPPNDRAN